MRYRNIIAITIGMSMVLTMSACGNGKKENTQNINQITALQEADTQESPTEESSSEKVTIEETTVKKKKKKKVKKVSETKAVETKTAAVRPATKATASEYIGKKLEELTAAIGNYSRSEKAESCYYAGEYDGIFYYNDFAVMGHTESGVWIIDSVE